MSKEQAELPLILAFQAYHFNKKYKGNELKGIYVKGFLEFETDKNEVLSLLRENTPRYFAIEEELEFIEFIIAPLGIPKDSQVVDNSI